MQVCLSYKRNLLLVLLGMTSQVCAFSLWSTNDTHEGTGEFIGPGSYEESQPLFEMVLKNLAFNNQTDLVMPFFNNGNLQPNNCGDMDFGDGATGALSNGQPINENADMCLANIAGTDMLIAVVEDGPLEGQQFFIMLDHKEIVVAMDIAFDLGIGEKGVIRMPFYGTTGKVQIPDSLQTRLNMPGGVNKAGRYSSGSWLQGRLGDSDKDGWLDGTMVAAGNIPLESPVFPGQPYAMLRHFEIDIPAHGYILGNVKAIHDNALYRPSTVSGLLINQTKEVQ